MQPASRTITFILVFVLLTGFIKDTASATSSTLSSTWSSSSSTWSSTTSEASGTTGSFNFDWNFGNRMGGGATTAAGGATTASVGMMNFVPPDSSAIVLKSTPVVFALSVWLSYTVAKSFNF